MIGLLLIVLASVSAVTDVKLRVASERVSRFAFAGQPSEAVRSSNAAQTEAGIDNAQPTAIYRMSGEKSLRPVRIGDDGTHMYLEWSEERALPAVFALNAIGEEEMVDGYMRAGIFTIDRVHQALVFRIGKKRAIAKRLVR